MKKIFFLSCMAAVLSVFSACEPSEEGTYEGTNYIYLSTQDGKTSMLESDTAPIVVEVMFSTSVAEDVEITFAVEGTEGVLSLEDNPVTVKAGEKTATFNIVSNNAGILTEAANFTITVDGTLPEGLELKKEIGIVVSPAASAGDLTQEQLAIIKAYKDATGVDLSKYLGEVSVTAQISGYDLLYEEFSTEVTGTTVIELSEESTAEVPVLKMVSNAMGIQDHFYSTFKAITIDNVEYWFPEEWPMACYKTLSETISWTSDSQEIFTLSLDGITLSADKSVSFTAPYESYYEEGSLIVPFEYYFSAFEREKAAIADGTLNPAADDEWAYNCTADPAIHMNISGIRIDEWEMEGEGYFVEASAEISAEKLEFVFCYDFDSMYAGDYTRVRATYTPNN